MVTLQIFSYIALVVIGGTMWGSVLGLSAQTRQGTSSLDPLWHVFIADAQRRGLTQLADDHRSRYKINGNSFDELPFLFA